MNVAICTYIYRYAWANWSVKQLSDDVVASVDVDVAVADDVDVDDNVVGHI